MSNGNLGFTSLARSPVTVGQSSGGGSAWSNLDNVKAQDGMSASASLTAGQATRDLFVRQFAAATLPAQARIRGVKTALAHNASLADAIEDDRMRLMLANTPVGESRASHIVVPIQSEVREFGGLTDLWGLSQILTSDVDDLGALCGYAASGAISADIGVDWFPMALFYALPLGQQLLFEDNFSSGLGAWTTFYGIWVTTPQSTLKLRNYDPNMMPLRTFGQVANGLLSTEPWAVLIANAGSIDHQLEDCFVEATFVKNGESGSPGSGEPGNGFWMILRSGGTRDCPWIQLNFNTSTSSPGIRIIVRNPSDNIDLFQHHPFDHILQEGDRFRIEAIGSTLRVLLIEPELLLLAEDTRPELKGMGWCGLGAQHDSFGVELGNFRCGQLASFTQV